MMLLTLVLVPLVGGLVAWVAARWGDRGPRYISLGALAVDLSLLAWLGVSPPGETLLAPGRVLEIDLPWIPRLGIHFHLALDGLSLLLVVLTALLGIVAVAVSWRSVRRHVGFFHVNLLWTVGGAIGVFLALDLLLFYFFWELMLVPTYFLIGIWGHEHRARAALKFFLFTQAGGLLTLVGILALGALHYQTVGVWSFDYDDLRALASYAELGVWVFGCFVIGFLVKLPVVPVHAWLPDAHTEAPTAGSVLLAGVLLKTGAYGLIRFAVPLWPDLAERWALAGMALGVLGILYGAVMALAQTDAKRLIAYSSISHMGFVALGVFAWTPAALEGAVFQMICHGITTGALFILVGALEERTHTRDLDELGGLWKQAPRMGALALIFVLASLGLPGLGNFVGEFLVLVGAFQVDILLVVLATAGIVFATLYSLRLFQGVFHGSPRQQAEGASIPDLRGPELTVLTTLAALIFLLGMAPRPVLELGRRTVEGLPARVHGGQVEGRDAP